MNYNFDKSGNIQELTKEELVEADKNSSVLIKNTGKLSDGTPYWAYIAVRPSKYKEFIQATKAQLPICLTEYGVILECGFEETVPDEIMEKMKELYEYDEHYMDNLARDIRASKAIFLKEQEDKRINDIVTMLKKKS